MLPAGWRRMKLCVFGESQRWARSAPALGFLSITAGGAHVDLNMCAPRTRATSLSPRPIRGRFGLQWHGHSCLCPMHGIHQLRAQAGVPVLPMLASLLLAGWNLLCPVDDSKDIDLIRFDVIDDSERPVENLPNLWDANSGTSRPDRGNSAICWERRVRRSTTRRAYSGEFLAT